MTEPRESFEARTAPIVYVVSHGLFGSVAVLGLLATLKNQSALPTAAIPIAMGIAHAIWLRSFRVHIQNRTLTYRTLFAGTRSVRLDDIERAEREVGLSDKQPFYRLLLVPKVGTSTSELRINTGILRTADVTALYERLTAEGIPVSR